MARVKIEDLAVERTLSGDEMAALTGAGQPGTGAYRYGHRGPWGHKGRVIRVYPLDRRDYLRRHYRTLRTGPEYTLGRVEAIGPSDWATPAQ